MQKVEFFLDGRFISLTPSCQLENGNLMVPIHAFAKAVGAEVKELGGKLAVCEEDLCIPLSVKGYAELSEQADVLVALREFAEPLGLQWEVKGQKLWVTSKKKTNGKTNGLSIGDFPPDFKLPDLDTDELVSISDYRGKKTVFFMWASW